MTGRFTTVEDYLDSLAPDTRRVVGEVRATIHAALPGATDTISYDMPTVEVDGHRVVHYAGWKHHLSLYPAPDDPQLADEIAPYVAGKGTLKFPLDRPVPLDLVARVVVSLSAGQPW